jgi:hypothetical protein
MDRLQRQKQYGGLVVGIDDVRDEWADDDEEEEEEEEEARAGAEPRERDTADVDLESDGGF